MEIIAIVGEAGVGKDTFARMLSEVTKKPILVSYTTRPMREGEVNGREHIFVSKCKTPWRDMLAHCYYGGYEYWIDISQVKDSAIYIVDERTLVELRLNPRFNVISILVTRSRIKRMQSGITVERMRRDSWRMLSPLCYKYNYIIQNEGTLEDLLETTQKLFGCNNNVR